MRYDVALFLGNVKGSIRIPKGSKPRPCKGGNCEEMIYDVPPEKDGGRPRPVSIARYHTAFGGWFDGIAPTETEDGAGISHFANCPDSPSFHKPKRPR